MTKNLQEGKVKHHPVQAMAVYFYYLSRLPHQVVSIYFTGSKKEDKEEKALSTQELEELFESTHGRARTKVINHVLSQSFF